MNLAVSLLGTGNGCMAIYWTVVQLLLMTTKLRFENQSEEKCKQMEIAGQRLMMINLTLRAHVLPLAL